MCNVDSGRPREDWTVCRCRVRIEGPGCPLVTSPSVAEPLSVAVKMLKPGHTEEELISLVKEIEIMKAVGGHRKFLLEL